MNMRRATQADSDFLLALRNDPETVKNSFNQKYVSPEEHRLWLEVVFSSRHHELYIAETDTPVGSGRLDIGMHDAELSVAVHPAYRRKGYATEIIRWLMARAKELGKIPIAQIKSENAPSLVAFLKAGMIPEGEKIWMRTRL